MKTELRLIAVEILEAGKLGLMLFDSSAERNEWIQEGSEFSGVGHRMALSRTEYRENVSRSSIVELCD